MGENFFGGGAPGGKILGVAPKCLGEISRRPTVVQNKATIVALRLTVWPQ